ncbi:MAG: hypothetical protein GTO45_19640 [Candidatus Aminicenantes bacterium]|nr:hypothetical protein [Candidatus Aminicenantes bacterium]NIM81005.1 hypothetical protein [Candidatus Aminicenantes bacterium]NIN20384.1 hypothetical protein [Candidatus Aminicenantes bacterium]NIN44157.1 hypothetical protein [Candidatus Aminicenantes bacterium]NIN86975.1 hypothetical protein [Candidatus Aminicenantes bacterium]
MNQKIEAFFKERTSLWEKYQYPGTFKDYAEEIAKSVNHSPQKHNSFMLKLIIEEIKPILHNEIPHNVLEDQLSRYPILSTADHHALLNYRLLYNSNLLYLQIIKELKLPFIVASATGSIPLSNNTYPRGFYFKKMKWNFFTKKPSNIPVYLFPSKLTANKKEGIKSFILNYSRKLLTEEEEKFLEHLFFDCLKIEKAARDYDKFSDQITFLNYKLWKYYFDKSIRDSVPDIIYFQINRILVRTLIEEIKKEDSLISLILFDPDVRLIFLKNFYGIQGAWKDDKGTRLFWGISEKKRFVSLEIDLLTNSLVGKDFRIELQREALIEALMKDNIFPSLFFTFLIITFLEGYVALGGSNQLDYLPKMQKALIKSLKEIGMNDMADRFASRVTDKMICGMFPFDFDSGIDLIWHYNSSDGKFNGNLDGGITQDDLDRINNTKVQEMILKGIKTMMEIV